MEAAAQYYNARWLTLRKKKIGALYKGPAQCTAMKRFR